MQHFLQILSFQVRQITGRIFIYCMFPSFTKHRVNLCFIIVKLQALTKARIWLFFYPCHKKKNNKKNHSQICQMGKRKKPWIYAQRLNWCLTLMINFIHLWYLLFNPWLTACLEQCWSCVWQSSWWLSYSYSGFLAWVRGTQFTVLCIHTFGMNVQVR